MTWNDVYKENILLDKMFYDTPNLDIIRKNKLELLVEIGEFANETKCFKYWSTKLPNKEKSLEELADCFIMCLSFFNYLHLDLNIKEINEKQDVILLFLKLYELGITFAKEEKKETINAFFNNLLLIGFSLGYSNDEMINACLKKIRMNIERIKEEY